MMASQAKCNRSLQEFFPSVRKKSNITINDIQEEQICTDSSRHPVGFNNVQLALNDPIDDSPDILLLDSFQTTGTGVTKNCNVKNIKKSVTFKDSSDDLSDEEFLPSNYIKRKNKKRREVCIKKCKQRDTRLNKSSKGISKLDSYDLDTKGSKKSMDNAFLFLMRKSNDVLVESKKSNKEIKIVHADNTETISSESSEFMEKSNKENQHTCKQFTDENTLLKFKYTERKMDNECKGCQEDDVGIQCESDELQQQEKVFSDGCNGDTILHGLKPNILNGKWENEFEKATKCNDGRAINHKPAICDGQTSVNIEFSEIKSDDFRVMSNELKQINENKTFALEHKSNTEDSHISGSFFPLVSEAVGTSDLAGSAMGLSVSSFGNSFVNSCYEPVKSNSAANAFSILMANRNKAIPVSDDEDCNSSLQDIVEILTPPRKTLLDFFSSVKNSAKSGGESHYVYGSDDKADVKKLCNTIKNFPEKDENIFILKSTNKKNLHDCKDIVYSESQAPTHSTEGTFGISKINWQKMQSPCKDLDKTQNKQKEGSDCNNSISLDSSLEDFESDRRHHRLDSFLLTESKCQDNANGRNDMNKMCQIELKQIDALDSACDGETYGLMNSTDSDASMYSVNSDASMYSGKDVDKKKVCKTQLALQATKRLMNKKFGKLSSVQDCAPETEYLGCAEITKECGSNAKIKRNIDYKKSRCKAKKTIKLVAYKENSNKEILVRIKKHPVGSGSVANDLTEERSESSENMDIPHSGLEESSDDDDLDNLTEMMCSLTKKNKLNKKVSQQINVSTNDKNEVCNVDLLKIINARDDAVAVNSDKKSISRYFKKSAKKDLFSAHYKATVTVVAEVHAAPEYDNNVNGKHSGYLSENTCSKANLTCKRCTLEKGKNEDSLFANAKFVSNCGSLQVKDHVLTPKRINAKTDGLEDLENIEFLEAIDLNGSEDVAPSVQVQPPIRMVTAVNCNGERSGCDANGKTGCANSDKNGGGDTDFSAGFEKKNVEGETIDSVKTCNYEANIINSQTTCLESTDCHDISQDDSLLTETAADQISVFSNGSKSVAERDETPLKADRTNSSRREAVNSVGNLKHAADDDDIPQQKVTEEDKVSKLSLKKNKCVGLHQLAFVKWLNQEYNNLGSTTEKSKTLTQSADEVALSVQELTGDNQTVENVKVNQSGTPISVMEQVSDQVDAIKDGDNGIYKASSQIECHFDQAVDVRNDSVDVNDIKRDEDESNNAGSNHSVDVNIKRDEDESNNAGSNHSVDVNIKRDEDESNNAGSNHSVDVNIKRDEDESNNAGSNHSVDVNIKRDEDESNNAGSNHSVDVNIKGDEDESNSAGSNYDLEKLCENVTSESDESDCDYKISSSDELGSDEWMDTQKNKKRESKGKLKINTRSKINVDFNKGKLKSFEDEKQKRIGHFFSVNKSGEKSESADTKDMRLDSVGTTSNETLLLPKLKQNIFSSNENQSNSESEVAKEEGGVGTGVIASDSKRPCRSSRRAVNYSDAAHHTDTFLEEAGIHHKDFVKDASKQQLSSRKKTKGKDEEYSSARKGTKRTTAVGGGTKKKLQPKCWDFIEDARSKSEATDVSDSRNDAQEVASVSTVVCENEEKNMSYSLLPKAEPEEQKKSADGVKDTGIILKLSEAEVKQNALSRDKKKILHVGKRDSEIPEISECLAGESEGVTQAEAPSRLRSRRLCASVASYFQVEVKDIESKTDTSISGEVVVKRNRGRLWKMKVNLDRTNSGDCGKDENDADKKVNPGEGDKLESFNSSDFISDDECDSQPRHKRRRSSTSDFVVDVDSSFERTEAVEHTKRSSLRGLRRGVAMSPVLKIQSKASKVAPVFRSAAAAASKPAALESGGDDDDGVSFIAEVVPDREELQSLDQHCCVSTEDWWSVSSSALRHVTQGAEGRVLQLVQSSAGTVPPLQLQFRPDKEDLDVKPKISVGGVTKASFTGLLTVGSGMARKAAGPRRATCFSIVKMCQILLHLKQSNVEFPVLKVFKRYLDCKVRAVRAYAAELERERAARAVACKGEPSHLTSEAEAVGDESPGSEVVTSSTKGRRRRRSDSRQSRAARKRRRVSGNLSSGGVVPCNDGSDNSASNEVTVLESARASYSRTDSGDGDHEADLPAWAVHLPYVWTDMFAPVMDEHMIGNEGTVCELRLWLERWKQRCQEQQQQQQQQQQQHNTPVKRKPRRRGALATTPTSTPTRVSRWSSLASDSDWCSDATYDSDDSTCGGGGGGGSCASFNTVLLSGPPGCGKTAAVYALAQQLGYKVLEVNASSRRTGKSVTSKLAEATQSQSFRQTQAHFLSSAQSHELYAAQSAAGEGKRLNAPPAKQLNPIAAMFQRKKRQEEEGEVQIVEDPQVCVGSKKKKGAASASVGSKTVKRKSVSEENSKDSGKISTKAIDSRGSGNIKKATPRIHKLEALTKKNSKLCLQNKISPITSANNSLRQPVICKRRSSSPVVIDSKTVNKSSGSPVDAPVTDSRTGAAVAGAKEYTLVLFEDMDLVFGDKDEGFVSAVNSLMLTSKRPIVITTTISGDGGGTLQLLKHRHGIWRMVRPEAELLAQHLQLAALAACGVLVPMPALRSLVQRCQCDVRAALHALHLHVQASSPGAASPAHLVSTDAAAAVASSSASSQEGGELQLSDIFPDVDVASIAPLSREDVPWLQSRYDPGLDNDRRAEASQAAGSTALEGFKTEYKGEDERQFIKAYPNKDVNSVGCHSDAVKAIQNHSVTFNTSAVAVPTPSYSQCHAVLPLLLPLSKHLPPTTPKKKYPFSLDDPVLKKVPLYQRYSWLDVDSNSDTEDEGGRREIKLTSSGTEDLRKFRKNGGPEGGGLGDAGTAVAKEIYSKTGASDLRESEVYKESTKSSLGNGSERTRVKCLTSNVIQASLESLAQLCNTFTDLDILCKPQNLSGSYGLVWSPSCGGDDDLPGAAGDEATASAALQEVLCQYRQLSNSLCQATPGSDCVMASLEDEHSLESYHNYSSFRAEASTEITRLAVSQCQKTVESILRGFEESVQNSGSGSDDSTKTALRSLSVPDLITLKPSTEPLKRKEPSSCAQHPTPASLPHLEHLVNTSLCQHLLRSLPPQHRLRPSSHHCDTTPHLRQLTRQDFLNRAVCVLKRSRRRTLATRGGLLALVGVEGVGETDQLRLANAMQD